MLVEEKRFYIREECQGFQIFLTRTRWDGAWNYLLLLDHSKLDTPWHTLSGLGILCSNRYSRDMHFSRSESKLLLPQFVKPLTSNSIDTIADSGTDPSSFPHHSP
jgi:hypothetical protein